MPSVFDQPIMKGLFGDQAAHALWSADAQIAHYKAFEVALAMALEQVGRVAKGQGAAAADTINDASLDIAALADSTSIDGLPIPGFVKQLRANAPDQSDAIHTGATSQDVLDTALSLTLRGISDIVAARLGGLQDALANLTRRYGTVPLTGRTRMQAALPITVANRVESWSAPLAHHATTLTALRPRTERLQLGGAVGTNAAFGADARAIAASMAQNLDLAVSDHVWHSDRSSIVDYGTLMSQISGTLGKMGQDLCLMAQQGIDEVQISGGGGSSAMPHKANPILAELLVTLARFNATQIAGLHHALVHEQERSGAAWALEWMILPQMTVATCRGLGAAVDLCNRIERIGTPET